MITYILIGMISEIVLPEMKIIDIVCSNRQPDEVDDEHDDVIDQQIWQITPTPINILSAAQLKTQENIKSTSKYVAKNVKINDNTQYISKLQYTTWLHKYKHNFQIKKLKDGKLWKIEMSTNP